MPESQELINALDEKTLYALLGGEWYDQFSPQPEVVPGFASSVEVGKREFNSVLPKLRESLGQPHRDDFVECVSRTITHRCSWRMPASIVAALAAKRGLAPQAHTQV